MMSHILGASSYVDWLYLKSSLAFKLLIFFFLIFQAGEVISKMSHLHLF